MKLIKPSTEILHVTPALPYLLETAGRVCYKSEDKMTSTSHIKFLQDIIKRGHESVIEHANATVKFICDRGVTHEIVRHRLASYSQESTRYCDYDKGEVTFIIPPWCETVEPGVYQDEYLNIESEADAYWVCAMLEAESQYKWLRGLGWRPEHARSVLPNSLKTEIVMTANMREWRHFFKLRCAKAAHPQMREVAIPLLIKMQAMVPVLFDDIVNEVMK